LQSFFELFRKLCYDRPMRESRRHLSCGCERRKTWHNGWNIAVIFG